MTRNATVYRRLPGRGLGLASYHRLYLGPDHLLAVASTGYSESYKRFYFRDIQAVLVQRTALWLVLNVILGAVVVLAAGVWLWALRDGLPADPADLIAGGVATLVCVGPLLLHLFRGPTCVCYVRTAVQIEKLPGLARTRKVDRVLQIVRPLIEAAQGPWSPTDQSTGTGETTGGPPGPQPVPAPPVIGHVPRIHDDGRLHRTLSWLFIG